MAKNPQIFVSVPDELDEKLKEEASRRGLSTSAMVRDLLMRLAQRAKRRGTSISAVIEEVLPLDGNGDGEV